MANQFYVQPVDMSRGLAGLGQTMQQVREQREQQAAQKRAQQRFANAKQDITKAWQSGDPMQVAQASLEYPEFQQVIQQQVGIMDKAKKQDASMFATDILNSANDPQRVVDKYNQRIKYLEDNGRDATHTKQSLQDYLTNPQAEMRDMEMFFASTDPDLYKTYKESTAVKPAKTREVKRGNKIVTEEFDSKTGSWNTIAESDRFNPNSGVKVDVNTGNNGPQFGNIPPGYMMVQTKDGWQQMPVPGSKPDMERKALEEKKAGAKDKQSSTANLVSEDIGRAKKLIQESPNLTTGLLGPVVSKWGGTPAADVDSLLDTVGANISFDYLNTMRQNSPTGGALGNVTERELDLLRATAGSLKQSQSAEQLLYNLDRLERQFNEVVHGTPTPPNSEAPESVDPDLWQYMTPEQKALWN